MFAQRAGQFYLTQLLFKNYYMAGLKWKLEIKNQTLISRGNNNNQKVNIY